MKSIGFRGGRGARALTVTASADTELHIFMGSQQRPDVWREAFDKFEAANPGMKVVVETGGATSELQAQYLNTRADRQGLDARCRSSSTSCARRSSAPPAGRRRSTTRSATRKPSWRAISTPIPRPISPAASSSPCRPIADSMFLYYRKDLLDKYGLQPPKTWDDLTAAAKKVMDGEGRADLQGLSFQGKAIEGAVCTFLLPYWSMGKSDRHRRQAHLRPGRGDQVADAVEGLRRQRRRQEEHLRGRHRRHPQGIPGRQCRLRHQLGLRLDPFPRRRGHDGEGQGRRGPAPGGRRRLAGDLPRRLAVGGLGLFQPQGCRRRSS